MDIFLARQAIYDRNKETVAYEMLYRNSFANKFDDTINAEDATYAVIENILTIGLKNIVNNKKILVNCEEKTLLSDVILLLPKNNTIIEVLETVRPYKVILDRLQQLKDIGYILALDDVITTESALPFIKYISLIKIDYTLTNYETRLKIVELAKEYNVHVLAEKIENDEEFIEAYNMGINYFQGYYFSKPSILTGKDVIIKNSTILQILPELTKASFDLEKIENLFKSDVILTYKLLNYINSAHFGFKMEISSVKQAIMLIGMDALKKWLSIIAFLDMNKDQSSEYTNASIIRAKFCENIASRISKQLASEAFMVGVFSNLHSIIDEDSEEVIAKLPLKSEIKKALLGKDNMLKRVLDLIISYENMDLDNIIIRCNELKIDSKLLKEDYLKSIAWVEELMG